jgi:hypothetical protein
MARWVNDNEVAMRNADPDVGQLQNRVADNWRALFAIADAVGGEWPKRLRAIAATAAATRSEQSIRVQLLTDIKAAFEAKDADRMSSEDLTNYLVGLEGHPWVEWKEGKPLTKTKLSRLLAPFGINSETIRIGSVTVKGYHLHRFEDAFERYISFQNVTTSQAYSHSDKYDFQNVTSENHVTFQNGENPLCPNDCDVVTFSDPPTGNEDCPNPLTVDGEA